MLDKIKILTLLLLLSAVYPAITAGQAVEGSFNRIVFDDRFDTVRGNWKIFSNAENLFLIQDGEYILHRKNASTAYSVFCKWKNNLPEFELSAGIIIDKTSSPVGSAGIIFMAQDDGSGAIVFECNQQGQYRLRQLTGTNYRLLSGDNRSGGWAVSPFLRPGDQENILAVRFSNRNYDLYINNNFLLTFSELAYKSGQTGIIVGPSTLARIKSFIIKTNDAGTLPESGISEPAGTSKVSTFEAENVMLRDSLAGLRKQLEQCLQEKRNSRPEKEKHGE